MFSLFRKAQDVKDESENVERTVDTVLYAAEVRSVPFYSQFSRRPTNQEADQNNMTQKSAEISKEREEEIHNLITNTLSPF